MAHGVIDIISLLQGGPAALSAVPYSAYSYPLDLPDASSPAELSITPEVRAVASTSPYTYATQIQDYGGERWLAQIVLPPLNRDDAAEWQGFLMLLRGPVGTFLMGDPTTDEPRGSAIGAGRVYGPDQSGRILVTAGWSPLQAELFKAGDAIQIGQRYHRVLRTASSDVDGIAVLDIWPQLRETPPDGEQIITNEPKGLFRLTASQSWRVTPGLFFSIQISAVEAI